MTTSYAISAEVARRFLVLRHLLAPPRALPSEPASVMRVVDRLGSLQFDPLEVAGRNHDVTLLARIDGYRREWTDSLLYQDRVLFEAYNKGLSILPTAELPWHRWTWDEDRTSHEGGTFDEHAPLVEELLEKIRRDGALSPTDVEPRASIEWYWRPTNQVRAILEALAEAGILGIARREGNRRVYDLIERLFPADLLTQRPPEREQLRHRLLSRHRGHGLLGASAQQELWTSLGPNRASIRAELRHELVEAGRLVRVTVERLRGDRFVLAPEVPLLEDATREIEAVVPPGGAAPAVTLLAPLDPFVWDRGLLASLYGFDYVWEVYVPAAKRRWGYYVLPILYGDRLVGRIEPRIDRKAGALRILGAWREDWFDGWDSDEFSDALASALDAHRRFADLGRIEVPRRVTLRQLARAVRRLGN
ncbi:MAG TPA: crosslink repair DNA glycosylase YcaQ family protein [Candidatus Limnocylindrales bacterium]|nr:crosslink repair DNA glycosylase YcaQ family protein [Candidatus Limnocylindrales bacterium]